MNLWQSRLAISIRIDCQGLPALHDPSTAMMPSTDLRQQLFQLQQTHHDADFRRRLDNGTVETWLSWDNADSWGSALCLEELRPLLANVPQRRILTLGDGKGGKEARFCKELGHYAVATDLCTDVLAEAHARGLIDEYAAANVEALPFDDESFDYVVVKETLHHVQRPYLAVYEMLRVAREGIIIIEPHHSESVGLATFLKRTVRRLFARNAAGESVNWPRTGFEESGNYLFRFQPFKLAQCMIAMGYTSLAYTYAHAAFEMGCAALRGAALESYIAKKRRQQAWRDRLRGKESRALLVFAAFKQGLDAGVKSRLVEAGFQIPKIRANPYLSSVATPPVVDERRPRNCNKSSQRPAA